MQHTIEQSSQQEQQAPGARRGWWKRKESKRQRTSLTAFDVTRTEPESFYERAIEWTHRADKIINLVLGYFLAVASVLGFMDVLSNGEVLGHVPFLFYIWLLIMGLGVDFQILLVIGRVPDLARMVGHPVGKWILVTFNIAFLAFLAYVSIIIGAVFTQHRDVPGTISQAMGVLGINSTNFVYERAALATFLLILMAVDRTMERWRMQIAASNRQQHRDEAQVQSKTSQDASPSQQQVQANELTQVIQAMQEMNAQNLAAMQAMNNETMQRFSQVTVELVRETIERTVATIALPDATSQTVALNAPSAQSEQQVVQEEEQEQEESPDVEDEKERDTEALYALDVNPRNVYNSRYYGTLIEAMYQGNKDLTIAEIVDRIGCSRSTASRWLKRVKPIEA